MNQGIAVECIRKSRRLPEVSGFIDEKVQGFLYAANRVSIASVAGDAALVVDASQGWSYLAGLARSRFEFMQKIPYLLCRVLDAGVAAECP